MKLSRRLPRFNRRLDYLDEILTGIESKTARSTQDTFTVEKCLIQIQIEWEHFVRALILDSATGSFSNEYGLIVSKLAPKTISRESASHLLISTYSKQQFEPKWYLPEQAIVAAQKLQISNAPQVSAELGLSPWPISELRHLRNFIAHKSKSSALSLRGAGLVSTSGELDILHATFHYGSGGLMRYSAWISFIKRVAAGLVA